MPVTYGIQINEDNLDLVTFLNDGIRPTADKTTYLICSFGGPREITTSIKSEDDLYDSTGHAKDTLTWVL